MAAVAWSTAGLLQRDLGVDTPTQLAGRALFATLALAGFVLLTQGHLAAASFRRMGAAGLALSVCMAIASGAFILALNHANVANVLFLQAATPFAAALLAWFALREAITPRTGTAMVVALLGVTLMVGGTGSGGFIGVTSSIVMTLAFAVGLVITRHQRHVSMAPALCLSQILLLVALVPFASPHSVRQDDVVLLALLGVVQMGLGLAFLTIGARILPASEVALITLLEVVLGPIWVWLAFSEQPATSALVGGGIVLGAVFVQLRPRASVIEGPHF